MQPSNCLSPFPLTPDKGEFLTLPSLRLLLGSSQYLTKLREELGAEAVSIPKPRHIQVSTGERLQA